MNLAPPPTGDTFKPHPYQQRAIDFLLSHPAAALFLDMGLGKTVITLTALSHLIDSGEVERVLIVAPKKVAEVTWAAEVHKWAHLRHLRVSTILGTLPRRNAASCADADIFVTSRDLLRNLIDEHPAALWRWDTLVLDELTSFKSHAAQRFKALRKIRPRVSRVIGLTGTPAPNGLLDLWAQIYCLDMGQRLGRYVTHYRRQYFNEQRIPGVPHAVRLTPRPDAEAQIRAKIADITLTMQATDYLSLPPLIVRDVIVTLPPEAMKQYRAFEREKLLAWDAAQPDRAVLAASAAALAGKLQQMANGGVYTEGGDVHEVHRAKAERLAEIVEAASSPVLVFYQFQHDPPRCLPFLSHLRTRQYQDAADLEAWNRGELDVLFAHPASTAYGLNLQEGGHHVVWLGTGWNLEHYQQANARLHRQGQKHPVIVHRLLSEGTIDQRAATAMEGKSTQQQDLISQLKQMRQHYDTTH